MPATDRTHRILLLAVIFTVMMAATPSLADTFDFQGPVSGGNSTWYWNSSTTWVNSSGGTATIPGAGDLANLTVPIEQWTYLDIQGGASVGSIHAIPNWNPYRVRSSWSGTRAFHINNNGATSVFTIRQRYSGVGQLMFAVDSNAIQINLHNDLLIQTDVGRTDSSGRLTLGPYGQLTGGSAATPLTITTLNTLPGETMQTLVNLASNTFYGTWVVDGAGALLTMQSNTFGDAANGIVLRNGGELQIGSLGAGYVLNRSLSGQGTVDTGGNGLTLGAGSIDIATVDDLISIEGQLTLGASAILNVTAPFSAGDYVIVSSDTGLSGTFGTENLGGGMSVTYGANDVTLHVVPEPASMALLGVGSMLLLGRRRRG